MDRQLDALVHTAQRMRVSGGTQALRCTIARSVLFGRCLWV